MALHPDFPCSSYDIFDPDVRWFPADEALRESSYEKLLPPLVHELREKDKYDLLRFGSSGAVSANM
jgi:type III restriction enzyme